MNWRLRLGLAAAAAVALADQASKWWLAQTILPRQGRAIELLPFVNLVEVWNRGMSFGLFNQAQASWAFVVLAALISAVLLAWLARAERPLTALSLGLVLGGAAGNVVDRLRFGAVFDFLDVHAAGWHWPAFNLADSAISVGVALLLLDGLSGPRKSPK